MPLILARHLPFFFYQRSLTKSVSLWKGFHALVTPSRGAATGPLTSTLIVQHLPCACILPCLQPATFALCLTSLCTAFWK